MSAVIVRDDIVHYEVLGRGPGVLFMHGWVGSWRYWIPTMQAVSARYRAYAVDLWGFGDSGKQPGRYAIDEQVDLTYNFLDRLGVAKIALVAHGLGGLVALRFAHQYPALVARMMVINTPLWIDAVHPRLHTTATVDDLLTWLSPRNTDTDTLVSESNKIDIGAITSAVESLETLDLRHPAPQPVAQPDDDAVVLLNHTDDSETASDHSTDAELPPHPPCLLVHSENDPTTELAQLDWIETSLNGSGRMHYLEYAGATHFPMLEDSARFNRLVLDFLEADQLTSLELKDEWKRRMR